MTAPLTSKENVGLRAPLTLRWSVKGEYGLPVISGSRVVVRDFAGGIVCFEDGRERWRYRGDVGILIAGAAVIGTEGKKFVELDLASGEVVRSVDFPWDVAAVGQYFFPERGAFLGRRSIDESEGIKVREIALVRVHDLAPLWWVSSRGGSDEVFGLSVGCGDGQVYVVRADTLLAFDLDTGKDRWATRIAELSRLDSIMRMGIRPIAAKGRVIVSAPGLTVTCDAATGKVIWSDRRVYGAGVVSDGRVYCGRREFVVLDLDDGRVLLEANLQERIERKWGFRGVEFHTGLAVSETHFFMGDSEGRLYGFEKETGEPVWFHRPKGGNPYFGNEPVISNNRLYITTVKPGPYTPTRPTRRPGALYCYEGAVS